MEQMTSRERVYRVLAGQLPDRVPVLAQNFQNTANLVGAPLDEFCRNARLMADAQMAAWERFQYDIVDVENGTVAAAGALGCQVEYPKDQPPRLLAPAIGRLEDVGRLQPIDPSRDGTLPVLLEATRLIAHALQGRACILGEADQGPFNLAAMLVGMETFLLATVDPNQWDLVNQLLEFATEQCRRLALAQIDAGADFTQIGEPLAGPDVSSPAVYRQFAFPFEKRLAGEMRERGIPFAIHICGNSTRIMSDLAETGAAMLQTDSKVDMTRCRELTQGRAVLIGNVDTTLMATGTPDQVQEAARIAVRAMGRQGWFFLSSGCTIGATTPFDSTHALMSAADRFGRYDDEGLIVQ
jgi:uroporphyrinogen decarboxylase